VTVESHSRLLVIGAFAFEKCSALSSICIPSSVERLDDQCFHECRALSAVRCEWDSHLSSVGTGVFSLCPSLSAIYAPPSMAVLFCEYVPHRRR
jgi:hypothetical protein